MRSLRFQSIDFEIHSDLCVKFRADSFVCSFNTDRHFWERYGQRGEKYLEQLRSKSWISSFHLWEEDRIIGQIELGVEDPSSRSGHVYLYYLVPEKREQGYGKTLDDFAVEYLQGHGAHTATLTVSPINHRAIHFYERQGWINLGQNPEEAKESTTGLSAMGLRARPKPRA